jgi:hypothetical protein
VALARHLGGLDLQDVRITNVKAEERVEWEAERISGTVLIKPSGWGTKVTLQVSREIMEAVNADETPADAGEAVTDAASSATGDSGLSEEGAVPTDAAPPVEATLSMKAAAPAAAEEDAEPAPKRGFLAKLFRRRKPAPPTAPEAPSAPAVDPAIAADEQAASEAPDSAEGLQAEHAAIDAASATTPAATGTTENPDLSTALQAAEEVAADEVTAVLTATLDRLGAAHHRPFSRA